MDSETLCEVTQRAKSAAGVKAFLVLAVAVFNFAIVSWCIGADELMADAQLLLEERFVNSSPLSIWTRSTRMPRRVEQRNSLLWKSAEE